MRKTGLFVAVALFFCVSSVYGFGFGDAMNAVSSMQVQQPQTTQHSQTQTSDLSGMLMQQLGVTQKQADGGVGSILSYAKDSLPSNDYKTLSGAIPNSNSLLSMAPSAMSSMGAMGSLGGMGALASQFSSLGLSSSMITQFVPIILNYLKGSGSTDAMSILSGLFN